MCRLHYHIYIYIYIHTYINTYMPSSPAEVPEPVLAGDGCEVKIKANNYDYDIYIYIYIYTIYHIYIYIYIYIYIISYVDYRMQHYIHILYDVTCIMYIIFVKMTGLPASRSGVRRRVPSLDGRHDPCCTMIYYAIIEYDIT